jgi:hypothetical protein
MLQLVALAPSFCKHAALLVQQVIFSRCSAERRVSTAIMLLLFSDCDIFNSREASACGSCRREVEGCLQH